MNGKSLAELGAILLAGAVLGLLAGWQLWSVEPPARETYAPAQALPPSNAAPYGAQALERKPDAAAQPKQTLPPKHKAERVVTATVQSAKPGCPDTTLDMTLARAEDGSQRVIASSPDGLIVRGLDVPVVPAGVVRNLNWAAGVSYAADHDGFGGWLDRDTGPFRWGIEVNQDREDRIEVRAKLGLRF